MVSNIFSFHHYLGPKIPILTVAYSSKGLVQPPTRLPRSRCKKLWDCQCVAEGTWIAGCRRRGVTTRAQIRLESPKCSKIILWRLSHRCLVVWIIITQDMIQSKNGTAKCRCHHLHRRHCRHGHCYHHHLHHHLFHYHHDHHDACLWRVFLSHNLVCMHNDIILFTHMYMIVNLQKYGRSKLQRLTTRWCSIRDSENCCPKDLLPITYAHHARPRFVTFACPFPHFNCQLCWHKLSSLSFQFQPLMPSEAALLDTHKASQLFDCKADLVDLMTSHNQTFVLSQEYIQWLLLLLNIYQLSPSQRLFSFRADVRWADHKLSCSEKKCDTVTILRLNVIYGSQACIDVRAKWISFARSYLLRIDS